MTTGVQPLAGVRVLDLSRVLAGPWCTQILADFGAEVIKVERPVTGDDTRGWGPPYAKDADGNDSYTAAYFMAANRGKKSITIDLAHPEGQALIRNLAKECDIVVENFKVDGLKKYGLDYASLSEINPALIYCSITGFGQTGPYRHQAGYDYIIQGMAGLMSVTGEADGEPMKTGVAVADTFTGLYAVIAIQAALLARAQSGRGQHIDMALMDTQLAVMANQAMNYLIGGFSPTRLGNAHPNIVPYQVFETSDGHFILAVGNDRQFGRLCDVLGLAHLAVDERYKTNDHRVLNRADLVPQLADAFKTDTTANWLSALEEANIPHGAIHIMEQVFADEQVQARGMKVDLPHTTLGSVPGVRNPISMSDSPVGATTAPPDLGEHTEDVLSAVLGLDDEKVARLRESGAI